MTKVFYLYGGWPGHNPYGVADWARGLFKDLGFDVEEANDTYRLDRDLTGYDLIALNWNNGPVAEGLTASQESHLLEAVESGTGVVAWHGAGAAFRLSLRYHMLLGADPMDHPAGEAVRHPYRVSVVDREHPVTAGVQDFDIASEQYYMNVDPRVNVLAETVFDGKHIPWIEGTRMPQIWTSQWGAGRVFYSAIGHFIEDLQEPSVTRLMKQGFQWAARVAESG